MKNRTIRVKGIEITIFLKEQDDYISLADIVRYKDQNEPIDIIKSGRGAVLPLNLLGFGKSCTTRLLKRSNSTALCTKPVATHFMLSPDKWIETTNAISITTKRGHQCLNVKES